jgi:tRNA threonylcarbamoyl adenosine modification protein YeaZ
MSLPLILHLDTTTNHLHLALSHGETILAALDHPCDSHRYHSALIVPAIQEMLAAHGFKPKHLTALAVNQGPGSFTGIRTGIITARTMAQFLEIPVYVMNPFELLATQHGGPIAIYIDALRNRTYHAVLSLTEQGPIYTVPPTLQLINPEAPPTHSEALWVSPTLAPLFHEQACQEIPADFKPASAMLQLIRHHGPQFKRHWEAVHPLYVQEPSVTLKRKPSPSSAV